MNADLTERPYLIDGHVTLPQLFESRCKALGQRTAHREKDLGIWLSFSWADFWEHVRLIGLGLISLGLKRGDVVSILSEDNKEWVYCDIAIQCVGGISCGIYTTDSPAQLEYLINDSASRFLIVENDEQLDKFLEVQDRMAHLEKAIVIDPDGLFDFSHERVMFLDELYAHGRAHLKGNPEQFEEEIAKAAPDDTAILIYTSGTTGAPKGAMISHSNIFFSLCAAMHNTPSLETDEQVCFLPLCHVFERVFSGFLPIASRNTINFAESPETVFDNVQEVSPHTFIAVPRLWEKLYSRVTILVNEATGLQRWAFRRAVDTGLRKVRHELAGQPVPVGIAIAYRFWNFAVLSNMRRMLGMDRVRRCSSGAAPISPDLLRWFRAVGIPLYEGYGMTETTSLISTNTTDANSVGTVGRPVKGAEVRIADDGEIQYRAGNVFQGYWRKPDKTAETFTEDGWLRTGDVGEMTPDGFVRITGRLKDIIITAGGKNITPAEIENRLKFSPYISDAVVIGDKRKYLTCLIMIDQENVEKYAQEHRVPFSDFRSLCATTEVQMLIRDVMEETNRDFARVEQIKDFRLIDVLLTAEDEELTATMKLKRGFVERKHHALIEQMYD
ncbi:long-chain fatty acid--CoA ligase [Oricola cellulosilytica]|uniref:Long-chain fatty acid--CoA ligase n=2 Tax=Oricola cellulosilytica TaxID=1429082 RepID=A0A4R0PGN4_9HYPH|nr:long-chain fatty acid--CoA ligase [Oricola cellulosilytica]